MSTEKMREEFEAAYLRGDFYAAEQGSEVQFQDFRKHCAYVAYKTGWKASRAAIEVKPPEKSWIETGDGGGFWGYENHDIDLFLASIESLGIKVKP